MMLEPERQNRFRVTAKFTDPLSSTREELSQQLSLQVVNVTYSLVNNWVQLVLEHPLDNALYENMLHELVTAVDLELTIDSLDGTEYILRSLSFEEGKCTAHSAECNYASSESVKDQLVFYFKRWCQFKDTLTPYERDRKVNHG